MIGFQLYKGLMIGFQWLIDANVFDGCIVVVIDFELQCYWWAQYENLMKHGLHIVLMCTRSIQFENLWNMVPREWVKVVAFYRSMPTYWYKFMLVHELGGCISLPVEDGERVKVVAFYSWVPVYCYEYVLVEDCKYFFLYIKKKT